MMRLVFAGTPDFAVDILDGLIRSRYRIDAVLTQPDRRAGRGRKLQPSPVKKRAREEGLPVFDPTSLRRQKDPLQYLGFQADAMITAAYGLMIPDAWLAWTPLGVLNVHPSLLPRWRGAAPIERAILSGDTETGISIMQMDAGLDTGPILLQKSCPITSMDTGNSLASKLADLSLIALLEVLDRMDSGCPLAPKPQDEAGVTYAHKLSTQDSAIDWNEDARCVSLRIRALDSRKPAFSFINGIRVCFREARVLPGDGAAAPGTILSAGKDGILVQCGTGRLLALRVQLGIGSAKVMSAAEVVNGYSEPFSSGKCFDGPSVRV